MTLDNYRIFLYTIGYSNYFLMEIRVKVGQHCTHASLELL